MATNPRPAAWAAATTSRGVPPPSDSLVWTWTAPLTRV